MTNKAIEARAEWKAIRSEKPEIKYIIWSNEHQGFVAPQSHDNAYVKFNEDAKLFTLEEANGIIGNSQDLVALALKPS